MTKKALSGPTLWVEEENTNLDAVTSATNGSKVETRWYEHNTWFIDVPVNTGAVTVNIEVSFNGTDWYNLESKTYDAVGQDIFSYGSYFPWMRTTTDTQSNATVTTTHTGRS